MNRPLVFKLLTWGGVTLALVGTLSLYLRPNFLRNLADQLWSCF